MLDEVDSAATDIRKAIDALPAAIADIQNGINQPERSSHRATWPSPTSCPPRATPGGQGRVRRPEQRQRRPAGGVHRA